VGAGRRPLALNRGWGERLAGFVERATLPIFIWQAREDDFRLAELNAAAVKLCGAVVENLVGATPEQVWHGPVAARRDLIRAAHSDAPVEREITYVVPATANEHRLNLVYVALAPDLILSYAEDRSEQHAVEERLRATEDRHRALVSALNEGVWLVDTAGNTRFVNLKAARMLGRPIDEVLGGNLLDFVDERDRVVVAAALECPRDTPDGFEATFRHSDGHELLCLLSVSPHSEGDDKPSTLCVLADMTALQHERELRLASERNFRRIVETANEGILTVDRELRATFVNHKLARMLGEPAEDLVGRLATDFVVDRAPAAAVEASLRRDGRPVQAELRLQRSDGARIDVIARLSVLRDEDGKSLGGLLFISDVTQLKREHAELRESRERFAQVFEEAPAGIVFIGAGRLNRGRFLGANHAFRDMLGYSEEELREHDLWSVTHPGDADVERGLARGLFDGDRTTYELDKRYLRADGSVVWARFRASVLRDENGAPLYGLGVAVDISAQKEAGRVAVEAAGLANAVLESTPDAVVEVTAEGVVMGLNGAAVRMFGSERTEILGRHFAEAILPEQLRASLGAALGAWMDEARSGPSSRRMEITAARADGSEFAAELALARVAGSDPLAFTFYIRNLEGHDRPAGARHEADVRFERVFRDSPTPMALVGADDRLLDVNSAFCELVARSPVDLIGRRVSEVLGESGKQRHVTLPNGRTIVVEMTISDLVGDDGEVAYQIFQCTPHGAAVPLEALAAIEPLSYRERQVLGLLAQGLDGPAVAERLGIAPETVRSYAQSARDKLGAKTRTHAVAMALMMGEISL
jgi:PAS domain S-box-containing protein